MRRARASVVAVRTLDAIPSFSWIGPDDYGVVERVEGEAIATRFFDVVIPVWPMYSVYLTKTADGAERRIRIALQLRSVVLGYLRTPLWLTALILAAPALMVPARWLWLLGPALGVAVAAALLTFVAGRLGEDEQLRRALLRRVVGFGAPPELLPDELRAEVRANLELMWNTLGTRLGWMDAIEQGMANELLVALAEYEQDPALIARARANSANKVWN